jgi:hypothetical protein
MFVQSEAINMLTAIFRKKCLPEDQNRWAWSRTRPARCLFQNGWIHLAYSEHFEEVPNMTVREVAGWCEISRFARPDAVPTTVSSVIETDVCLRI